MIKKIRIARFKTIENCLVCTKKIVIEKGERIRTYCSKKCIQKKWKRIHHEKVLKDQKIYREVNREELRKKAAIYHIENREARRLYQQERSKLESEKQRKHEYYLKNKVDVIKRSALWKKENPQSTRRQGLEEQQAMNNVRKRDKNTCQWYGCKKTHRDITIHVHHIFPKNEYPDLELVEQYMICYCKYHHAEWHKARGDNVSQWIMGKKEQSITQIIT